LRLDLRVTGWSCLVRLIATPGLATEVPDEGSGPVRRGRVRLQHMSGNRGWACLPWDRGWKGRSPGEPVHVDTG
jgi:hypothetical protein